MLQFILIVSLVMVLKNKNSFLHLVFYLILFVVQGVSIVLYLQYISLILGLIIIIIYLGAMIIIIGYVCAIFPNIQIKEYKKSHPLFIILFLILFNRIFIKENLFNFKRFIIDNPFIFLFTQFGIISFILLIIVIFFILIGITSAKKFGKGAFR